MQIKPKVEETYTYCHTNFQHCDKQTWKATSQTSHFSPVLCLCSHRMRVPNLLFHLIF